MCLKISQFRGGKRFRLDGGIEKSNSRPEDAASFSLKVLSGP
jgi:hypothetical protein